MKIGTREIGPAFPPLVVAEIGINADGKFWLAMDMIKAAADAGAECVKFQCHIPAAEMVPNDIIPSNASESIWDMMNRCAFSENAEIAFKRFAEDLGMIYLSTPFSIEAVERLERLGVLAYKIGSGELTNRLLLERVAATGKPVIVSTGMHADMQGLWSIITDSFGRIGARDVALLHCVSTYPSTPADMNLKRMRTVGAIFNSTVWGLSSHCPSIAPSIAAVALGASIIEHHFTIDRSLPGADNCFSLTPPMLRDLITMSREAWEAMQPSDTSAAQSQTARFAFPSIVTLRAIGAGEVFSADNLGLKRPGTGIAAGDLPAMLGKRSTCDIPADVMLSPTDVGAA